MSLPGTYQCFAETQAQAQEEHRIRNQAQRVALHTFCKCLNRQFLLTAAVVSEKFILKAALLCPV